jgi:hypothetical protein
MKHTVMVTLERTFPNVRIVYFVAISQNYQDSSWSAASILSSGDGALTPHHSSKPHHYGVPAAWKLAQQINHLAMASQRRKTDKEATHVAQ